MNFRHYDEASTNAAWEAVETEFKQAGMAEPAPGFADRWKTRMAERRVEDQRRQARIVLIINTSLMALVLLLIGAQTLPAFESLSDLLVSWFDSLSEVLIWFQMIGGIWSSLSNTLPNILPDTFWMSVAASLGILLMYWFSSVRRYARGQERI